MFPNTLPNQKYHIYLDSNQQIELCSINSEAQYVYRVAYFNFCFANINRFLAAYSDIVLLILKLHIRGKITLSLINNEVRYAYIGYNFICHIERKDLT